MKGLRNLFSYVILKFNNQLNFFNRLNQMKTNY